VDEDYEGRRQWEVEDREGKRYYMTAAEINERVKSTCSHHHPLFDRLLNARRCSMCGRIIED
jgi:hypothetical protein